MPHMPVESLIEDARWSTLGLPGLADRAAMAVLAHQELDAARCDISLLACNDTRIGELNQGFRGKAGPTNVLSWPERDLSAAEPGGAPVRPIPDAAGEIALGDIAIAWETCAREAAEAGIPMADHVAHLIVHGVLHLLGYDHVRDADATLMEQLETAILGRLGLKDPYTITDGP